MSGDYEMIITLPSGDTQSIGDASNYTIPMPQPINLDPQGTYEIALIDASFSNPGNTNNSVFILSDIVDYSIVGSSRVQILYKTEPMLRNTTDLSMYYMKEDGSLVQWRPLFRNTFNAINIRIQQSDGTPIPTTHFSIITIAIKRVR
jgi:hypothetical protein